MTAAAPTSPAMVSLEALGGSAALRGRAERMLARRTAARVIGSFPAFVRYMWPEVEPGRKIIWSWHMALLCREAQQVLDGGYHGIPGTVNGRLEPDPDAEVRWPFPTRCPPGWTGPSVWVPVDELAVCIPPGFSKSIIFSVMLPAYDWLGRPHRRSLYVSNADDLAVRDSVRTRDLINSDRYAILKDLAEQRGTPRWTLARDQNEKTLFKNTRQGFRQARSYHGKNTGKRGDILAVDDPLDASDAVVGSPQQVAKRMSETVRLYDFQLASRLNDQNCDPRIVVQQRLHPLDLAGQLISRGVRHVCLPNEYDPNHPHLHPDDPRTERGELLCPEILGRAKTDQLKHVPDAGAPYAAQYQQWPQDDAGGFFRRSDFRSYELRGELYYLCQPNGKRRIVPRKDCWTFISADTAMTDQTYGDYTAIGVWDVERRHDTEDGYSLPGDVMLRDVVHEKMESPDVEAELRRLLESTNAIFVSLENSVAGKHICQRFQRDGLPVRACNPGPRSKVARAVPAQLWFRAGRVYLPAGAPWRGDYERELLSFPTPPDDFVDMTAWAIITCADRDLWREPPSPRYEPGTYGDAFDFAKAQQTEAPDDLEV